MVSEGNFGVRFLVSKKTVKMDGSLFAWFDLALGSVCSLSNKRRRRRSHSPSKVKLEQRTVDSCHFTFCGEEATLGPINWTFLAAIQTKKIIALLKSDMWATSWKSTEKEQQTKVCDSIRLSFWLLWARLKTIICPSRSLLGVIFWLNWFFRQTMRKKVSRIK